MSRMQTTGSITSGSDQLVVANVLDFQIDDWIVIEIGGEAGAGARGTRGVGGVWPALSYADVATMDADTTKADQARCWVESTGDTYYWNAATTDWIADSFYYTQKAVPKALWARITNISGNTLTLSKTASATATNANVYFDNWGIIQDLLDTETTITLPPGTYYVSDFLVLAQRDNITIEGAGQTSTILKTPKGASHGGLYIVQAEYTTIRNLAFEMQFLNTQYSFRWSNGRGIGTGWGYSDPELYPGWAYGKGVEFSNGYVAEVRNVSLINCASKAVTSSFCPLVKVYDCIARIDDPIRVYIQWQFQATDSDDCEFHRCHVESEWYITGFESFKSRRTQFLQCSGRNAALANNSADGTVITDIVLTMEDDRQYDGSSFSVNNPIMNFNDNAGGGYNTLRCTVTNPTITHGAANVAGARLRAVEITSTHAPVDFVGTYQIDNTTPKGLIKCTEPWNSYSSIDGLAAIVDGVATFSNMRFRGEAPGGTELKMVYKYNGSSGNITLTDCVIDNGLQGTGGTVVETGTLTNAEFDALHPGLP